MNTEVTQEHVARAWLTSLSGLGRPWGGVAVAAGLAQGMAMVAFSGLLAWLLHELVIAGRPLETLSIPFLLLPLFIGLRALAGVVREEAGMRASAAVRAHLRTTLLDRTHALGPAWHGHQQGGALASQLLEQVEAVDGYFARYRPQQWLAILVPVMILAVVFPLNWVAGVILLATAPLIPLFMAIVGHGARAQQTRQMQVLARMSGQFLDTLRGLTTLRLLDAHGRHADVIAHSAETFRVRTMSVLRLAFLSGTVLEFFASIAIALSAVYLGFSLLGVFDIGFYDQAPTLFVAMFVLLLAPEFYMPLRELGTHYHARAEALAAAEQLQSIATVQVPESVAGTLPPALGAPSVLFDDVGFEHRAGVPVFEHLTLSVGAGEAVAVVGASGAGKTTLMRLLLGQLHPTQGRVLINGVDVASLDPVAWRERIGWMSQHPRLLAATLADNLRIARIGASDECLVEALEFAGLGDWFIALPDGLETLLGEGGRLLSGGQLRRLALARVRLRNARLLLLDEPTASLDRATERLVIERIAELRRDRTLVLLSHRTDPLRLVDRVIRLDRVPMVAADGGEVWA